MSSSGELLQVVAQVVAPGGCRPRENYPGAATWRLQAGCCPALLGRLRKQMRPHQAINICLRSGRAKNRRGRDMSSPKIRLSVADELLDLQRTGERKRIWR
jgi:hypothetical protein